jgi:hypothetical protein
LHDDDDGCTSGLKELNIKDGERVVGRSPLHHPTAFNCSLGDAKKAQALVNILRESQQDIPAELEKMASHMGGGSGTIT